jgi:coatomer protein complex subunit gamma
MAFRSSQENALTETEMEYVVTCVKHVFVNHVVLQFSVLNTIDDQRLKDVRVDVEVSDPDAYTVLEVITAPTARYGERTNCFVSLARTGDPSSVTISCELHFKVIQVDPATGSISSTH